MKKLTALTVLAITTAACSDRGLHDPRAKESHAPVLTIEKPARGLVLPDSDDTLVKGHVSDAGSGIDVVLVNGVQAEVEDDGDFSIEVPLVDGVTLLQTIAIDKDGNQATDTRAVLQGTFVNAATPVHQAVAARINDRTLNAVGDITAELLTDTDIGARVRPMNPMLDKGFSCLEVQLHVEDVQKSLIVIDLVPTWGGISVSADVFDLYVPMDTDFEVLCVDGSAGLELSADRFHLEGNLLVTVDPTERLAAEITLASAYFEDFNLDVGIVPGEIVEMIYEDVDDVVAGLIVDMISEKVPEMLEEQLSGFGIQKTTEMMGQPVEIAVKPTAVEFTPQGGTIVLDSRMLVKTQTVADGPGYLSTPAILPAMPAYEAPGDGFRLALADDVLNQALSAFWAAGVMEKSIAAESGSQTGLSALIDRIDVFLPFPPTVASREAASAATVTAGDVRLNVVDVDPATGAEFVVTALAISAEIGLDVETDATGVVRLRSTSPLAWVDVLEEEVTGPNPLSEAQVELLSSFVVQRLSTMIGGIVGEVPVPSFASARITHLSTHPTDGYIMLGGNVEPLN